MEVPKTQNRITGLHGAILHYEAQFADVETLAALRAAAKEDPELAETIASCEKGPRWLRLISYARLVDRHLLKVFIEPTPEPRRPLKIVGEPLSQGNPRPTGARPPQPAPRPVYQLASQVVAQEQRWLHPGRFPLGTVSLIAGNMGVGKSTFISSMVATVTRGWCWPDGLNLLGPRSVILVQDEESLAKTQRPRLDRFGADLDKVAFFTAVQRGTSDTELQFSIARDVDALDVLCDKLGDVALVLIDPLGSFLGGISGFKESETRDSIGPLFRFAEARDIGVTAVVHLNKDAEKPIEQRISGSFALPAKARMVWYLSEDPNSKKRRLLSHLKGNLDGMVETALAFGYPNGRIVWAPKPLHLTAHQVDQLLRQRSIEERMGLRPDRERKKPKLPAARALILTLLESGPLTSADLFRKATDCGMSESTFRRALVVMKDNDRSIVAEGEPPVLRLAPPPVPAPELVPCASFAEVDLTGWETDGGAVMATAD